jgi:uncharacterized repeat protein (TIGR01451 family)
VTPHFLKRWFRSRSDASLGRREVCYRPSLEQLEARVMLDAGLPAAIVVGRTLSAYFTGDVQNNQETITYTVYNEQDDPVSGVLLTDTLEPGVTFQSASQLPDQNGQQLAWSLGAIPAYARASVTLMLSLANPLPSQLDAGARAFATLNGGLVSNAAPAATLRQGSIDPTLLVSTPDANTTDPYVQEEAAALDYNPQSIFNFLHNDIGYNSYLGSVRGARGTLWSSAGNALDVASLGVALMRASGIPAQYVQGTMSQSQAQQLILSMFPASFQTVGYVPSGTQTSDPANDPQLLSETESHYWFQFDAGNGMTAADPLMSGATIGQTFTTATGTFTEVPDNQREKTEVKLNVETYSQANALFGQDGISTTTVLDQTFNDVDLVGKPLTLRQFVNASSVGALVFSASTITYSPFLMVGDQGLDPAQDSVIRGQDYQDVRTNFPFTSQTVTGVFLDVALSGPDGPPESYERTLADRIGFATRQNGGGGNIAIDPNAPPILTPLDVFTLNVLPGLAGPSYPGTIAVQTADATAQLAEVETQLGDQPPSEPLQSQAINALSNAYTTLTQVLGPQLFTLSDARTERLAETSLGKAYYDRPRLVLISNRLSVDTQAQTATTSLQIDLRRDSIRAIAFPGQSTAAAKAFQAVRGVSESTVERDVGTDVVGTGGPGQGHVSAADVFAAARAQGVRLTVLRQNNLGELDGLDLSPEAKARITVAVGQGYAMIVPADPVSVQGVPAIAWYEVHPDTGEAIGVTEDGGHELSELAYGLLIVALRVLVWVTFTASAVYR